ncbi:MAG: SdpA family antimicrobial peptide system protein [Psychroflexus halocasei]
MNIRAKTLVFFFIIIFFWIPIVLYVLLSYLPSSPIKPGENKRMITYYIPQGWAFFSKSPIEENITIYKNTDNGLELYQHVNASPKYLFGLKKDSRAMNIELGRIIAELKPKWVPFVGEQNVNNVLDTIQTYKFENFEEKCFLKGDLVFAAYEPIPWAWAKDFNSDEFREGKMIKINISCTE